MNGLCERCGQNAPSTTDSWCTLCIEEWSAEPETPEDDLPSVPPEALELLAAEQDEEYVPASNPSIEFPDAPSRTDLLNEYRRLLEKR